MFEFRKQSGFAMLEVVLAIFIIAIASFGIYKLYNTSTLNSKLSAEEDLISQLYSTATQLSQQLLRQPYKSELYNYGAISRDVWPSASDPITAPFGTIGYSSDGGPGVYSVINARDIPGSVAGSLCNHMKKWGDIYTGGVDNTDCNTDITFSADKFYNINIYFPKGKYVKE